MIREIDNNVRSLRVRSAMATEQETSRTPLVDDAQTTTDYNTLFGVEREEAKFARSTVFGKVRNIRRFSWVEWIFVVVASFSMLAILGVIIERFVYFKSEFVNLTFNNSGVIELATCNDWICTTDYIFTVVLLLNLLFCAFYCYDGLLRERQFEMIGFAVAATMIIIYIIANYVAKGEEGQVIRLVRLVLACVFGPVNIVLALLIWWRTGFLLFNTIGSNEELNRAYKIQSFFLTLQDFNVQVFVSIVALAWAGDGKFLNIGEKVVLPILLAYALVTMVIGLIAVNFELRMVSYVWYFLVLPFFGYYVYKIADVGMRWGDYSVPYMEHTKSTSTPTRYEYVGAALIVVSCLGLLVCSLMEIFMVLSQRKFGQGLREKITPPFQDVCLKCATWCAKRRLSEPLS